MSGYMGNLSVILEKCQQAADGKLSEGEQAALASRVRGVFMSMHMFNGAVRAAEARDWHTVEGALANYIDVQEMAGHGTSVTQSVEQLVSVDVRVEISQAFQQIDDSGLSPENAAALKAMLAESQNAPDAETRAGKFVKAVEFVADKGPKIVDTVMKAGGAISQLPWPQM